MIDEHSESLVLYFNKSSNNTKVSSFVNDNYELLKKEFKTQKRSFFKYPENDEINTLKELYTHCYPKLIYTKNEFFSNDFLLTEIKNTDLDEGFFFINKYNIDVVEYNDAISERIENLYRNKGYKTPVLSEQLKYFKNVIFNRHYVIPHNIRFQKVPLEGEASLILFLSEIKNKLERISNSKHLFEAITGIENIIEKQYSSNNLLKANSISVDALYKIHVKNLKNEEVEIVMSNLTKSVYLLFCNHKDGINIKELTNYKSELLSIYTDISGIIDYTKMVKNINKICDINSKEIYVHISRVKKAFENKIPELAKHYNILGTEHGSSLKFIPVIKNIS